MDRDQVLAKAQEPKSPESIEAAAASRLKRGQQINALDQLVKMPEWKVFTQMVEQDELEKWEGRALDPTALTTGVTMVDTIIPGPDGQPTAQKMPSPIEGQSLAMQMCWNLGMAWGIKNTITYPERAMKAYARMRKSELAQQQLLDASGQRAPISGINTNPIEGGS